MIALMISSCDSNEVPYDGGNVSPSVEAALSQMGFTVRNHQLQLDDKVLSTTELNLTNKNLTDTKGLEHFVNLERLILDQNNFEKITPEFIDALPPVKELSIRGCHLEEVKLGHNDRIVRLNLEGPNSFEHIDGLTLENLPSLKSITLPESTKWNHEEIVEYYLSAKGRVDISIEIEGKLKAYDAKTKVPNEKFRAWLKTKYPEVFDENDMIDLTKEPTINDNMFDGNTEWTAGEGYYPMTFDATGMGDLDGYRFFKNRCIKKWVVTYGDFESLDMSNDTIIQELSFGRDYTLEKGDTYNKHAKYINVSGCKNLKSLTVSGQIESVDFSGLDNLESFLFAGNIKELDLSGLKKINMIFHLGSNYNDGRISPLEKIVLPKGNESKMSQLTLSKTHIKELDLEGVTTDDFFGLSLSLSMCPDLKSFKVSTRLGNGSTFSDGFFEDLDLRGATIWNSEQEEWIPATNNPRLYSNNPYLKTLNGEPYSQEEEADPEYVKRFAFDASNLLAWHYFSFDDHGKIKEVGTDIYPYDGDENITGQDAQWKQRKDWDFAIHRNNLRTNSGDSGISDGGVYEWAAKRFEETPATATQMKDFEFLKDKVGVQNMILSLSSMPPPRASVSMSTVSIFDKTGGMPPVYLKKHSLYVIKRAAGGYAVISFADYYTDEKDAHITMKYYVVK